MNNLEIKRKVVKAQPSFLMISDSKGKLVFEIKGNGEVWWLKNKKPVRAKTDKDLGKALGEAIILLVEMNNYGKSKNQPHTSPSKALKE